MGEAEVFTIWGGDNSPYMTRVILGHLRLHVFHRADADPDHHDHPSDFWTFPLTSYVEEIAHPWSKGHTSWRLVRAFRLHRRKAEFAHRVLGAWTGEMNRRTGEPLFCNRPIATIVWWGKKRREWGFHTAAGWVPWKQYVDAPTRATTGRPLGPGTSNENTPSHRQGGET